MRVLVVDDDSAVRASLSAYLEDEGFVLRSTGSAPQALSIIAGEPIDVAIVDIRLGEMDGQNLILSARQLQPGTKFLVYTGSIAYQLPNALMCIGMQQRDVMYKPVPTMRVVADEIRRLAGKECDDVRQQ